MKPITVTVWRYNRDARHWSPREHHRSASESKARQWATIKLGTLCLSEYEAKVKRLDFAVITRRSGKEKTVDQPIHYVPSCGEMGWW